MACASARPPPPQPVVVVVAGAPAIAVTATGALAARDVARVRRLLPRAQQQLAAWGLVWQHPVSLAIHSDPSTFIRATGQTVPSLRAWTTWRRIDLLATDTWAHADDIDVEQRLSHELCHLASWHRATTEAAARRLPRLVSEGVCSVVAGQAQQRLDAAVVGAALDDGRPIDFDADSPFAYAVAHHVVAGFVACRGASALIPLLDALYGGADVVAALGASPRELVRVAAAGRCG